MIRKGKVFKCCIIVLVLFGVLFCTMSVKAETLQKNTFWDEFYSGKFDIMDEDQNGQDVTKEFLAKTNALYMQKKIQTIKEIMVNSRLRAHIYKVSMPTENVFALEKYKIVSDTMIDYFPEDEYNTVMEFNGTLSGGIWYNPNTYEVTRVSQPTFKVNFMKGPDRVTVFCNNISTSSNVTGGKGYFSASFTCSGQAFIDEAGVWPIYYDYGRHSMAFYGTP